MHKIARALVSDVRANRSAQGGIDAFMQEYALSSEEGIVLMCLAEALLRIPDDETADRLIADKLADRDWERHMGQSESVFVNASAWGLMLTGRFVELGRDTKTDITSYIARLVKRSGEPVIRQAMRQAMRIMGKQFVLGRTIGEALAAAKPLEEQGYRFSYDMLGEAAMTRADADRYFKAYAQALTEVARAAGRTTSADDVFSRVSLSLKLSALHPRYEEKARSRALAELVAARPRTRPSGQGRPNRSHHRCGGGEPPGAVARRPGRARACPFAQPAGTASASPCRPIRSAPTRSSSGSGSWQQDTNRVLPVRLVKGAYWDTEIKRSQEAGYDGYPLFTRKVSTDVSYLACARYLLDHRDRFLPAVRHPQRPHARRRHGHGGQRQALRIPAAARHGPAAVRQRGRAPAAPPAASMRPVGSHEDLLAYLVRRLLENGANTSFVNRLADDAAPIEEIIADPVRRGAGAGRHSAPAHSRAADIFAPRRNSRGLAMWDEATRTGPSRPGSPARGRDRPRASAIIAGRPNRVGKARADHRAA